MHFDALNINQVDLVGRTSKTGVNSLTPLLKTDKKWFSESYRKFEVYRLNELEVKIQRIEIHKKYT